MRILILSLWLLGYLRRELLLTYWWQVKEYRLDRFCVFLKTREGRSKTDIFLLFTNLFLFLFSLVLRPVQYFYVIIIIWEVTKLFYELYSRQLRRPKITFRSSVLLFISSIFAVVVIFFQWQEFDLKTLLLADILSFFSFLVGIFLTDFFIKLILFFKRNKAISILKKYRPITIAITGSYGKSSTKHLLFEILKNFAPTAKTPGSYNTPLGVIRTINNLLPKTRYFLCEMGAYKKGEINALCQIVKPDFAVITGISPQHLALFGNMDNLIKAKYEIAQNLKPGGILFVNSSLPSTDQIVLMAKKDKINIVTYTFNQRTDHQANFIASIIGQREEKTDFEIKTPKRKIKFTTNLTSWPILENLVGAIIIALTLKIPLKFLQKVVAKLPEVESGLKIRNVSSNITLIDDSYNSNLIGFEAALSLLLKSKGFKVLVTEGIQELGKAEYMIHKNLGKKSKFVDLILTISPSFANSFQAGLGQDKKKLFLIKQNIKIEKLKNLIKTPAIILIEGRIPLQLMNTINKLS